MLEHGGYNVVGKTTFGKGTMQNTFDVPSTVGDELKVTRGKWLSPDENWVHKAEGGTYGVTPTHIVELNNYFYTSSIYTDDEIAYDKVGYEVENLQKILSAITDYTGRVDGYYDIATTEAVSAFQVTYGLEKTGNVDQLTASKLNEIFRTFIKDKTNDNQLQEALELCVEDVNAD
ncbi:unnamed protein product [marine sediment metagenome]|uniref:Tail specific protease domain-containing protein n=1 Tax=marine sediment metagenome TaxID=412755 RepID=X0ZBF7_9ZZZZ